MTDSEAAGLCSIAWQALMYLPDKTRAKLGWIIEALDDEIGRLRNQSPEDVQREFEK